MATSRTAPSAHHALSRFLPGAVGLASCLQPCGVERRGQSVEFISGFHVGWVGHNHAHSITDGGTGASLATTRHSSLKRCPATSTPNIFKEKMTQGHLLPQSHHHRSRDLACMPTVPDSECKSWPPNVLEPWPLAFPRELAPGYGEDIPGDQRRGVQSGVSRPYLI